MAAFERRVQRRRIAKVRDRVAAATVDDTPVVSSPDLVAEARRVGAALVAALDALGAPAFVLDALGRIRETNAAARTLLERTPDDVQASLAVGGRHRAPLHLERVAIRDRDAALGTLAMVRAPNDLGHRVAAAASAWELTRRQREVLALVVRGLATATIAGELGIGTRAVELHVTALFDRAGVESRAALVAAVLVG